MSEAPKRDFDITWVPKMKKGSGATPPGSVLDAFRQKPAGRMFVVDIAKETGLEFSEAVKQVLTLVADQQLEIVKRSDADDHQVKLTAKGKQSLQAS